jgi:outer membrane PBP1 activator LpoA protein
MIKNNTPRQAGVAYGRKKALLVLPVFLAVLILAGCSYQLPGSKKKETNQKVLIGRTYIRRKVTN